MDKMFIAIDGFFERFEKRMGKPMTVLVIGTFFLLLSMLISETRFETIHHGNAFTRLSEHPFGSENANDLRLRILSPLVGYLLFFRGIAFKYFMLIVLAVFFGLIYHFQRKNKLRPSESLGISAICVFSTLAFYQLFFPAYTDPMSFLLMLLLLYNYEKPYVATLLLSLMLFNHENTLFIFPFFFLLMLQSDFSMRNLIRTALKFAIALIPWIIYRKIILSHEEIEYTASYYFDPNNLNWTKDHVLPHLASGVFQAFRLSWIFPLAAIVINIYEKRYSEVLLIIVAIVFVLSQLIIAYDISRLTGMAFPIIILSALRMRSYLGSRKFLLMIYAVVLINFFIPSYCIGALEPISYAPSWMK